LSSFYNYLPEKDYYILNTQSIYYEAIGEPEQALEREKEQLKIFHRQKEVIDISRLYFNISDRYSGLGQLDSAMFYAQTSIDMIEDSNYRLNHLYYQNVADIAEKQGNYLVANNYRKQAAELYKNSVEDRLDTQITEIEKKYDLTESENRVLLAHQQSMKIIIAALTLIIILIVILTNVYRVRRNTKMELLVAENRLHQQELQTEIMEEEADKRKWLLQLYSNISDRLTFLQDEFEKLTQRYVSSQPKVYKDMQEILKNADTDLRDINKTLTPDANTFYLYTKLSDDNGILNDKEKLMLMLLSCDADNRELATFMNTTIESIRVRKSQLKKKMCENNMDVSVFGD
jgi:tetratricopeptide (TPR) repeat protein